MNGNSTFGRTVTTVDLLEEFVCNANPLIQSESIRYGRTEMPVSHLDEFVWNPSLHDLINRMRIFTNQVGRILEQERSSGHAQSQFSEKIMDQLVGVEKELERYAIISA